MELKKERERVQQLELKVKEISEKADKEKQEHVKQLQQKEKEVEIKVKEEVQQEAKSKVDILKVKEEIIHKAEAKMHQNTTTNMTALITQNTTSQRRGNGSLDDPVEQESLKTLVDQELEIKVKDFVNSDVSSLFKSWNEKSHKEKSNRHEQFNKQMNGYMQQLL